MVESGTFEGGIAALNMTHVQVHPSIDNRIIPIRVSVTNFFSVKAYCYQKYTTIKQLLQLCIT